MPAAARVAITGPTGSRFRHHGAFRDLNGTFAAHVVAGAIDALQSGALLESTGLAAGDAFAELGDLLLDGLSR